MQVKSAARLRHMSAFEFWMRTGRRIDVPYLLVDTEKKFNQRHYPENGQFARSGEGQLNGPGSDDFRGGGGQSGGGGASGDFGGGGARGSWSAQEKPNPKPKQQAKIPVRLLPVLPSNAPPQRTPAVRPLVRQTIIRNNYRFTIDAERRTREVSGQLHSAPMPVRSRNTQRRAGGTDRRTSDDGGHFIAARFNGPREWFNHFAQDANFNRGAYKAMENNWARSIASGTRVRVTIGASYAGASKRPS